MLSSDQNLKITIFFGGMSYSNWDCCYESGRNGQRTEVTSNPTWYLSDWNVNQHIHFIRGIFGVFSFEWHICYLKITQKTVQHFISSKIKHDDKKNNSHLFNLKQFVMIWPRKQNKNEVCSFKQETLAFYNDNTSAGNTNCMHTSSRSVLKVRI